MRTSLAKELKVSTEQIILVSVEEAQWPDSCLGIAPAGMMCLDVITSGYQVLFDAPQGSYEFRTREDMAEFSLSPAGAPGSQASDLIHWERTGGIAGVCQRLAVSPQGSYRLVDCKSGTVIQTGALPADYWNYLTKLSGSYSSYDWQLPAADLAADAFVDRYSFHGTGTVQPGDQETGDLNEYLANLVSSLADNTSQAIASMRTSLAKELNVSAEQIVLVTVEEAQWSDSCLGIAPAGMMCLDVITPGYRVLFDAPQGSYEFRTREDMAQFSLSPAGAPGSQAADLIHWERTGGIAGACQRLAVSPQGSYRLVDCKSGMVLRTGVLTADYWTYLTKWSGKYPAYDWQLPAANLAADAFTDQYNFHGSGTAQPTDQEKRELNDYLANLFDNLMKEE